MRSNYEISTKTRMHDFVVDSELLDNVSHPCFHLSKHSVRFILLVLFCLLPVYVISLLYFFMFISFPVFFFPSKPLSLSVCLSDKNY